jgi:hypothetical protein
MVLICDWLIKGPVTGSSELVHGDGGGKRSRSHSMVPFGYFYDGRERDRGNEADGEAHGGYGNLGVEPWADSQFAWMRIILGVVGWNEDDFTSIAVVILC